MQKDKMFFKGNITQNYNEESVKKNNPVKEIEDFFNAIKSTIPANPEKYLEISHKFSFGYQVLLKHFKSGYFLSNDAFESLLVYHFTTIDKQKLDILNVEFTPNSLARLKINEQFDLVYSFSGITFDELYNILPQIIGFAKIGGTIAVKVPAYWFLKEKNTELEKKILDYSKQNDKKWIFVDPLEPVIEKNGGKLLKIIELPQTIKINRFELAFMSSLKKLYDAELQNNKAHLEVLTFPEENLELRGALLLIKKITKTVTKDNLFNL